MEFIQWTDKLSVDVSKIDNEHKQLVAMINQLFTAMQEGKSQEIVRPILENMVSYAKGHFATEEKYFEQLGYPQAEDHIAEHKDFIASVNQFIRDYKAGKVALSTEILKFLKDWLSKHILGSDKQYSAFFNAKGVK